LSSWRSAIRGGYWGEAAAGCISKCVWVVWGGRVRGRQLELKGSGQKVSSAFNGDYKCTHTRQKSGIKNKILENCILQQQRRPRFGFASALTISIRYKTEEEQVEGGLEYGENAYTQKEPTGIPLSVRLHVS